MTGKKNIIAIVILLIVVLAGGIVYFFMNTALIGTIKNQFAEPTDNRAVIGVDSMDGKTLTFKLTDFIKAGEVQFLIIDSEENQIASFGRDIAEQQVVLEKDDTYEVVALSKRLEGSFTLKVYQNE